MEAPPSHMPLYHFTAGTLDRWQLQTDGPIGGFSTCALDPLTEDARSGTALWSGCTSLDADRFVQQQYGKSDQKAVASKVGFAAMMLNVEQQAWEELDDFHGVCLTCRPRDARNYVLTLRAGCTLGEHRTEDLYQTRLQPFVAHAKPAAAEAVAADGGAPSGSRAVAAAADDVEGGETTGGVGGRAELIDVRVPWGAFTLTWRGYVQGEVPPAMNLGRISHVGVLLADQTAGDFGIELARLSAFRFSEHELARDDHVRECAQLNEAMGYSHGDY